LSRTRLAVEVLMAEPKMPKKRSAARAAGAMKKPATAEKRRVEPEMLELLKRKSLERVGPKATFEQTNDAMHEIMSDLLWEAEDELLREDKTYADEIDVDGKKFRRLEQASSATYFGRFGAHHVEEPLYREVGVHNGPTELLAVDVNLVSVGLVLT
jgi:hypothetical protein